MRLVRHASPLKEFGVHRQQTEDCQGRSCIAATADPAVVTQLGEGLSSNHLRNHDGGVQFSLGFDGADRPAVVAVIAVEESNQESGVGERAQPPYTVSSIVSERSGGP